MATNAGQFKRRVPEHVRAQVARLLARGYTHREIAEATGLSRSTVGYLAKQPDVRALIADERKRERDRFRKQESRRREKKDAEAFAKAWQERRELEAAPPKVEEPRRWRDPFAEFLDSRDRDWEERAQNVARGRTPEGLVSARWPRGQSSYDPDDKDDVYRLVDLIADSCPELDPDAIQDKLFRADTKKHGAVVFTAAAPQS
jgi:Homeodomain-like domain